MDTTPQSKSKKFKNIDKKLLKSYELNVQPDNKDKPSVSTGAL
jgi:hypothetical protein